MACSSDWAPLPSDRLFICRHNYVDCNGVYHRFIILPLRVHRDVHEHFNVNSCLSDVTIGTLTLLFSLLWSATDPKRKTKQDWIDRISAWWYGLLRMNIGEGVLDGGSIASADEEEDAPSLAGIPSMAALRAASPPPTPAGAATAAPAAGGGA